MQSERGMAQTGGVPGSPQQQVGAGSSVSGSNIPSQQMVGGGSVGGHYGAHSGGGHISDGHQMRNTGQMSSAYYNGSQGGQSTVNQGSYGRGMGSYGAQHHMSKDHVAAVGNGDANIAVSGPGSNNPNHSSSASATTVTSSSYPHTMQSSVGSSGGQQTSTKQGSTAQWESPGDYYAYHQSQQPQAGYQGSSKSGRNSSGGYGNQYTNGGRNTYQPPGQPSYPFQNVAQSGQQPGFQAANNPPGLGYYAGNPVQHYQGGSNYPAYGGYGQGYSGRANNANWSS